MSDYEVIEGDRPAPLTQHEPRTIVRTKDAQIESMMSEIGDRVFVAWSICGRCGKHVTQCSDPAGPTEPNYIKGWRDEWFQKTLDARPNLTLDQEQRFVEQLRKDGWIVERPTTNDPAIDRARDAHGYDRPIEDVALPTIPIAEMVGVYDTSKPFVSEIEHTGKHEIDAQAEEDYHEDTCRMPHCDVSLDDGEGFDGYCGTHADKVYGHEQSQGDNPDELVHECDEDCPLWVGAETMAQLDNLGKQVAAIRDAARNAGFDPGF